MYRWVVLLHVLGALTFFLGHGASAAMAFRLRREKSLERIRALMEFSLTLQPLVWGSFAVLLIAGLVAGFMGNWWVQGWIGTALLLLLVLAAWMTYYTIRHYTPLRIALGLRDARNKPTQGPSIASEAEIAALIRATNPWALMFPAMGLTAVILWLMIFKPF